MRLIICACFLLAGCAEADKPPHASSTFELAGYLQYKSLDEASGLARSFKNDDQLWAINDDGGPVLYAIDTTGGRLGKVKLSGASNRDWEDLASFRLNGQPYLLVADIGDNRGRRKDVRIYVVEEPDVDQGKADIAWSFDFSYPNGPRDAEAVAVDVANERILILTKRDIPALLYSLPLRPDNQETIVAEWLGAIDSLPQPNRQDVNNAPINHNWYWQPTGMDISADGKAAAILTYGGVYIYRLGDVSNWFDTLRAEPMLVAKSRNREAESIAFGANSDVVFVTLEQRRAPLYRYDLSAAPTVTVMTFNAQNLFDNIDDPGMDDKTYLPIEAKRSDEHIAACRKIARESRRNECLNLDWSDALINHKLSVLAATIKQVNDGLGADIIVFQEIENAAIVDRLSNEFLADSHYLPAVVIEGESGRGIDNAFLSKLPLVGSPILHPVVLDNPPNRPGRTRGILEATFELPDGTLLTGFAVHFPAPYNPNWMRVIAYERLNEIRSALPAGRNVFAAGDFNTTSKEDAQENMLERFVRPFWTVAHEQCDGCPGTSFFSPEQSWSFLDMILYSPARGTTPTWQVRAGSVRLANRAAAQVTDRDTPARYDPWELRGVSDHWPLQLTLEPRP